MIIRNRTLWLGLIGVLVLWTVVAFEIYRERQDAFAKAFHDADVTVRLVEEHAVRTVRAVDEALFYFRQAYARDPGSFDLQAWAEQASFLRDVGLQLSLVDTDGRLIDSSLGKPTAIIDLSDREHFRVQLDPSKDELFISAPVLGRVSGKWTIQLSRKVVGTDGTFLGVVVASINPDYLSAFYDFVKFLAVTG